jgi:hypothetical protein
LNVFDVYAVKSKDQGQYVIGPKRIGKAYIARTVRLAHSSAG